MTEQEIQKIERAMEVMTCPTIEEGRALIAQIRELESAQRWIPAEERLPESPRLDGGILYGNEVLVFDVEAGIDTGAYLADEQRWYGGGGDYRLEQVTHWMPLPSAPDRLSSIDE